MEQIIFCLIYSGVLINDHTISSVADVETLMILCSVSKTFQSVFRAYVTRFSIVKRHEGNQTVSLSWAKFLKIMSFLMTFFHVKEINIERLHITDAYHDCDPTLTSERDPFVQSAARFQHLKKLRIYAWSPKLAKLGQILLSKVTTRLETLELINVWLDVNNETVSNFQGLSGLQRLRLAGVRGARGELMLGPLLSSLGGLKFLSVELMSDIGTESLAAAVQKMAHLEHLRVAGDHDSEYNVKMHHVLMFGLSSKPSLESLWVNYTRYKRKDIANLEANQERSAAPTA
jgi:hypothetical protein